MHLARRLPATNLSVPSGVEAPLSRWILVIAGPKPQLPNKMLAVQDAQRWIILHADVPCEQDRLPAGTLDLVAHTVLHRDVGAIVVLGQSKDLAAWPQATLRAQPQGSNTFSLMVQRLTDRMELMRRAQNRVRVQLNQIRLDPRIAAASISRDVSLCGLYHITESDAFLLYDHRQDRFVPHVDDSHRLG